MDDMTYADLLEVLQKMTPEQLQQKVLVDDTFVYSPVLAFEQAMDNPEIASDHFVLKTKLD
jgi:hypothetical protein